MTPPSTPLTTDHQPSDDLFDRFLDPETADVERESIVRELEASEQGRSLLDLHERLQHLSAETLEVDVGESVLSRLPAVGPAVFVRMANAVLEAWESPEFREELRRSPRGALATRGVPLPPELELRVVSAEAARLPDSGAIMLPIPPAGSPPITRSLARWQLRDTMFAWIWGPPWARPEASPPSGVMARLGGLFRAPESRPLRWVAAAAAVVAVLALGRLASGTGPAVPGAALATDPVKIGAGLALLFVALWWYGERHR